MEFCLLRASLRGKKTTDQRELINTNKTNTTLIIPDRQSRSVDRGLPHCVCNEVMENPLIMTKNEA